MEATNRTLDRGRPRESAGLAALAPLYSVEALGSVAGTLLSIGISFYMKDRFGWRLRENFMLAAAQGLVYVPGALSAGWLTARLGRRLAFCASYSALVLLSIAAWAMSASRGTNWGIGVAAALLAYTFVIGISWPVLESMVAEGPSLGLARRLAAYNVVWPAAGWIAIALEGTVMKFWIGGLFAIPAAMHLIALLLILTAKPIPETPPTHHAPAHAEPEPELLRMRKLALWLSRTALPATYTVIYGLMPIMPFLAVMKSLSTSRQTLVASVWLVTRLLAFVILALGTWWHTRPRFLLWAAVVMLVAFFGMTLPPTNGASPGIDLASMIAWQAVLGLALGMIYSGSLYFGMVLSEGSTEHGGYHEALIGLGWVLGPAAGAAAERFHPGEVWVGVAAVGAVIGISVLVVLATAVVMARENGTIPLDSKPE